MKELVAAKTASVSGGFEYDCDPVTFGAEFSPCALNSHDSEQSLDLRSALSRIFVISLIEKYSELSAHIFEPAVRRGKNGAYVILCYSLTLHCVRHISISEDYFRRRLVKRGEACDTYCYICIFRNDRLPFSRPLKRHSLRTVSLDQYDVIFLAKLIYNPGRRSLNFARHIRVRISDECDILISNRAGTEHMRRSCNRDLLAGSCKLASPREEKRRFAPCTCDAYDRMLRNLKLQRIRYRILLSP